MTSPLFKAATVVAVFLMCAFVLTGTNGSRAQEPEGNFGVGIPEVFMPKYLAYRAGQLAEPNPNLMRVKLGYVKGLSTTFTKMSGETTVNLQTGAWQTTLSGLTPLTMYTVSLVDQPAGLVGGLLDTVLGLVTFLATGPTALLSGVLPTLPLGQTIDSIVVSTPGLLGLGSEPLAAGTVNVFQKMFFRRLSLVNDSSGEVLFQETTPAPAFASLIPNIADETDALPAIPLLARSHPRTPFMLGLTTVFAQGSSSVKLDKLISQGANLFFNEKFGGNGRTCGTCHPASNNLTIDPDFIASRPNNDPLFVAEFNPALANLEKPALMRSFGLILENVDGFADPVNRFVMRGVPHTLGLQVSLERDPNIPGGPVEMTGWSGDGAPGTGSLREFAIGAVTQHFTKSLNRIQGTDFKLPKAQQLDAMEAFQLSTGRDKDFDLTKITFNDANVNQGENLFVNGAGNPNITGGKCAGCHNNGGALLGGQNLNINTNVEDVVHPARTMIQNFPRDGGFGRTPAGPNGSFGNGTFNLASVVEAADTEPFFHNNLVDTLEDAVNFYNSPEFNNPRAGTARFNFNQTQRNQIADFMRGLNVLQNIDVAKRELKEILANRNDPQREQDTRLQTAFDETQDSIEVLNEGVIFPSAVTRITTAQNRISQAQQSGSASQRRSLIQTAIDELNAARGIIATVTP